MTSDIIIVGAGVAGLTIAKELAKSGRSVIVLEARNRVGGRINTIRENGFSVPFDAGAEFIHGAAPKVHHLLKLAGIKTIKTGSNSYEVINGKLTKSDIVDDDMVKVTAALKELKKDITGSEFLSTYFAGPEHEDLRFRVTDMVEGFDVADIEKISAFSLRDEWGGEDEFTGHRPVGGYSQLIDYLFAEATKHGVVFRLSTPVKQIEWSRHAVIVSSINGDSHKAGKVIVTVPAAVLKHGSIQFIPALIHHQDAFQNTETGGVIKFLFEFRHAFWEDEGFPGRKMKDLGFVISDAFVPTWWTQKPSDTPLLTGWLAGPATRNVIREELHSNAIKTLSYIFECDESFIRNETVVHKIVSWPDDEYALGAYGYKTLQTNDVLRVVNEPVEETIYFAGEAFNDGSEMGTVEAAIQSAESVIAKIIRS